MLCPLCSSEQINHFYIDSRREYSRCVKCALVFVPEAFHLSCSAEQQEYDKHNNSPNDKGYRDFLGRLVTPLADRLKPGASGLDFGCGPGPAVKTMMREYGYSVENYDPIYANNVELLEQQFDFVVASEVVEHFRNPKESYAALWNCVKPNGLLGIMTKLVISSERFASWHYKNDFTHISFHAHETLQYLAQEWGASLTVIANDAFIFQRPESE